MKLQVMAWVFGFILISEMAASAAAAPLAKPNCTDRCGDVQIPYPFGTSKGCYLDDNYFVNCTYDPSGKTRNPMFGDVVLLNISLDGHFEFFNQPVYECYNESGTVTDKNVYFLSKSNSFSYSKNLLVAVGCDTIAFLNGTKNNKTFSMGCMSICQDITDVENGSCSGVGCCNLHIPKGLRNFSFEARSFTRHNEVWKFNPCSYAFITKETAFNFSTEDLHGQELVNKAFPVVSNWGIGNETCEEARAKSGNLCGGNSTCYDPNNGNGYRCKCKPGYDGNPYLPHGCQGTYICIIQIKILSNLLPTSGSKIKER